MRLARDPPLRLRAPRRTQVELCKEQVEWTRQEKRTFLRHRVELRLAALYLETLDYAAALPLISECAPRSPALEFDSAPHADA